MAGATKSYCRGCDRMFLSVAAFDFHRTGSFAHRTRRCLTAREMKAQGMVQNADGCWMLPVKLPDVTRVSAS